MLWFKSKDKVSPYNHSLDLSEISTIEQCRDMIIILSHQVHGDIPPHIVNVSEKALTEFPSLLKLKI